MEPEDTPRVPDVIVTPSAEQLRDRDQDENDGPSPFADFFGFDSGRFNLSDIFIQHEHPGHTLISVLGFTWGHPMSDDQDPVIGVSGGLDVDPRDGRAGFGPDTGVSYNPSVDLGWSADGPNGSYFREAPPGQGLGIYEIPGSYGETYFGPPPGTDLPWVFGI